MIQLSYFSLYILRVLKNINHREAFFKVCYISQLNVYIA